MCMMVYIGADNELPIIEYQGEISSICTRKLNDAYTDDRFAKENLTKEYKYYIGSWQGCGCGFRFDMNCEGFSSEGNERGKQSVQSLFDYIKTYVKNNNCELLSFWAGDGMNEPDDILKSFVLNDSFEFLEGQYITIKK